jgi:mRNA interferase RelE/StbE
MSSPQPEWQIILLRQPEKTLRKLPKDLLRRLRVAISELANNPYPEGCKKLTGHENLYRIRIGDWRISYAVEGERLIILVLEIAPRGSAYRLLR